MIESHSTSRSRPHRRSTTLHRLFLGSALLLVVQGVPLHAQDDPEPVQLFMPDGQLRSHPIRVFVNRELTHDMDPRLTLTASHTVSDKRQGEDNVRRPVLLAAQQRWVQTLEGQKTEFIGTLLIFDL